MRARSKGNILPYHADDEYQQSKNEKQKDVFFDIPSVFP
jgi:hypothetical protein